MDIVNFIFVYLVSGFVLSIFIKKIAKKAFDNKLIFILGFGISPLLISLILYYLYLSFPGNTWTFYGIIIYIIFAILIIFCTKELKQIKIGKKYFTQLLQRIKVLDIFKKIFLGFILFVVIFNLVANIFYRTQWVDAFRYLQQGFVYSQDRSTERLETREPFNNFGEFNRLKIPEEKYIMNLAIKPAIPIFYSFFYRDKNPNNFNFVSIEFIYSYYLILSILVIAYILSKNKKEAIVGLTLFLSCYYITRFSYINYKEIIINFYAVISLYLLYLLINKKDLAIPIIIGVLCGLMAYINTSGLIITGVIFVIGLLFFKSSFKKKLGTILITLFFFSIFSGGEIAQYNKFIFNSKLFSKENQEISNHVGSLNLGNNQIREKEENKTEVSKMNILIKGKLKGITQIHFFGFIYLFFIYLLITVVLKKIKMDQFSKLNLSFIGLFFFIIMDPLFLNHHKYAYVLNISEKYPILLIPFLVIFIAYYYGTFLNILKRIKRNHFLYILPLSIFLVSPIRDLASKEIFQIFKNFISLNNPVIYYLEKLNFILLLTGLLPILTLPIYLLIKKEKFKYTNLINALFIFVIFVIPFFFFLNNNQKILSTFTQTFNKSDYEKIAKTTQSQHTKQTFSIIEYINKNPGKKYFVNYKLPGSTYYNLRFYTKSNLQYTGENLHNLGKNSLLFTKDKNLINKYHIQKRFGEIVLLKL